jgi:hypothetical protein
MSKHTEKNDAPKQHTASRKEQSTAHHAPVRLRLRAALQTTDATYEQGEVIKVATEEVEALMREYASYFEVVEDDQEAE